MKIINFEGVPHALVKEEEDWGQKTYVLAVPPTRLWADNADSRPVLRNQIDPYQTKTIASPAELLVNGLPEGENWQTTSRRALARLEAFTLFLEDPQRRLEVREVETLAHQVSLVRHVLENPHLKRVLIADEVGLGKTIEAAMIIKELLDANPDLRVLYLAPARLVSNVGKEFRRMGMFFREWKAQDSDANFENDDRIIASIHRAVCPAHFNNILNVSPWDILVVDECHHLSDWAPGGGDPKKKYKLVRELINKQKDGSFLLMLSGTPHQANPHRFENLLELLLTPNESKVAIAGRVIFRTKDDVQDWDGQPLFPKRQVNKPIVCGINETHRQWLGDIHEFFSPSAFEPNERRQRAAGWRCAQALQWATSSPNAGLGYLVRQAMRAGWGLEEPCIKEALLVLRPYRRGVENERVEDLFERIKKEIQRQIDAGDINDIEEDEDTSEMLLFEQEMLKQLIITGVKLVCAPDQPKWNAVWEQVVENAAGEKIVLFAQPIETVLALAQWLKKRTGKMPAIIIGGQSDSERDAEIGKFKQVDGPQFLISSKAGGEGINLQFSRRLVHLDVPWNPMDMEQRIGRVHRFGSKNTVIVDTLVVRDSREEQMWSTARSRLASVSRTMVAPEKFESLFSRVMCLIEPEELQKIMLASHEPQMDRAEEETLSDLVDRGFNNWRDFHDTYAENQKNIRQMSAGLSRWEDIEGFLKKYAGALPENRINVTRFKRAGNTVIAQEEQAKALRMKNGQIGLVGDYSGAPVNGEFSDEILRLGLNHSAVLDVIREQIFQQCPIGAALLRWGEGINEIKRVLSSSVFVFIFVRQKIQLDTLGGARELGVELSCFYQNDNEMNLTPFPESSKRDLLEALRRTTTRVKSTGTMFTENLKKMETSKMCELERPSEKELQDKIRYVVWPVFCAHIIE